MAGLYPGFLGATAVRSNLPLWGKWDTAMLFSRLTREKSGHSRPGRHPPRPSVGEGSRSFTEPGSKKKQGLVKKTKKQLQTARAAVPKSVRQALAPTINKAIKSALISGGGLAGAAAGSSMGMGVSGSIAGSKLGARLSKAIGSGDYEIQNDIKANSLFKGDGPSMPSFGSSSVTRFKHREYIGDVFAGANNTFTLQKWAVQPALRDSFPYLAQMSINFTRYHMKGLIYEFVSTTSPYLAGGAMGSVVMAMQYDPVLPDFTSKAQMDNSDFAISTRPDKSIMYGVECVGQPMGGYYLRSSAGLATQPINFTDMGTMYIGVQNTTIPVGTSLGELWVTYDVEFSIPLLSPARFGYYHQNWDTGALTTTDSPFSAVYALAPTIYGDFTSSTYSGNGNTTVLLTFPNLMIGDTFLVSFMQKPGTGDAALLANTGMTINVNTNCAVATDANGVGQQFRSAGVAGRGYAMITGWYVYIVTGANPSIQLLASSYTVAQTVKASVTVTQLFGSGASV